HPGALADDTPARLNKVLEIAANGGGHQHEFHAQCPRHDLQGGKPGVGGAGLGLLHGHAAEPGFVSKLSLSEALCPTYLGKVEGKIAHDNDLFFSNDHLSYHLQEKSRLNR